MHRSKVVLGTIFGAILVVATLAGIEFLASFYAPAWPARAINPREPVSVRTLGEPYKNQPWLADGDNSWGIRDSERTIAKPAATRRAVFVGDSFVESRFTPLSLPAAVQQRLPKGDKIEAISLGVGATDPRSYYYRIRDVALELQPDAVLLFLYGNDFVSPDNGYTRWPRLIDESAGGSLVGLIMPRTNWLLVNRLDLAAFFRSRSTAPPNDEAILFDALKAPPDERLKRITSYVKKYHYPNVPEERLAEILSRGNNRFLEIAVPGQGDEQEYLLDWMFGTLMSWEARDDFEAPKGRDEVVRLMGRAHVDSTFSWLEATDRLVRRRGVPLIVFQIPTGGVDPDYAEFWKPWLRAYSWNYVCDVWQSELTAKLAKAGIRHVDLRENLDGIPGTYRKMDGHWTQKGEAIVADRVAVELRSVLGDRTIAKTK